MHDRLSDLRAHALLALVMLLWTGNSIVARATHGEIPPLTLAFVRWAGALLIIAPFAARGVWRERGAIIAAWKPILLLGLLGVGAFNSILYSGLQHTTATNALLLQAAIPPLVMLLDRALFGARASGRQALGVVFSIAGVAVIVFQGDPRAALRLHFGYGDALVLVAVVVWALYTVLLRLRPAIRGSSFIAVTFAVGAVAVAPFAAAEWRAGETVAWSVPVIGAFAYVMVLPSLVAYFIYNAATQTIGAARAGQAITLMPLFGALLSALLLGEPLHRFHFAGMAFILAGIVVGAPGRRRPEFAGAAAGAPLEERP